MRMNIFCGAKRISAVVDIFVWLYDNNRTLRHVRVQSDAVFAGNCETAYMFYSALVALHRILQTSRNLGPHLDSYYARS